MSCECCPNVTRSFPFLWVGSGDKTTSSMINRMPNNSHSVPNCILSFYLTHGPVKDSYIFSHNKSRLIRVNRDCVVLHVTGMKTSLIYSALWEGIKGLSIKIIVLV